MRIVVLGLCILLAACQAPSLNRFSVYTYAEERAIDLTVSDITVRSDIMHYDRLPHIENKLPISPEEALQEWANNRFHAVDKTSLDTTVITVKEAYMTQKEEAGKNWYTFDNVSYKLTYNLLIEFIRNDKVLYQHNVQGWESSSLPQRSSLAEKEATWQKMLNAMVRKVNQQITQSIPDTFVKK